MNNDIVYITINGKRRVQQEVDTISLYQLEGTYEEVIDFLEEMGKLDTSIPQALLARYSDNQLFKGFWSEKTLREVYFDKYFFKVGNDYEGKEELQVWGERNASPEEIEALETQEQKTSKGQQDRERAEFERLQKKFSK